MKQKKDKHDDTHCEGTPGATGRWRDREKVRGNRYPTFTVVRWIFPLQVASMSFLGNRAVPRTTKPPLLIIGVFDQVRRNAPLALFHFQRLPHCGLPVAPSGFRFALGPPVAPLTGPRADRIFMLRQLLAASGRRRSALQMRPY